MVSAVARRTYVFFDEAMLDCTTSLVSFDVGDELRSDKGMLPFTAEMVLGLTPELPAACNPLKNPSRLYRGTPVQIVVELQDGTLIDHPRGTLYVTEEPEPPKPDEPKIKFSLGCELTLQDWNNPTQPGIDFEVGTLTDRTTVVRKLMQLAKFRGQLTGSMPLYPLQTPPATGGNYVERMEKVAYGGLTFLYQTRTGAIAVRSIELTNLTPSKTIYVGEDEEIYYAPNLGGEPLCEQIKVTGVGHQLTSNYKETHSENYYWGPAQLLDPTLSGWIVTQRVVTTETVAATERRSENTIYSPWGVINSKYYPGDSGETIKEKRVESSLFEPGGERRLINSTLTSTQPAIGCMVDYLEQVMTAAGAGQQDWEAFAKEWIRQNGSKSVTAEETRTGYTYGGDGTVRSVETSTYKPMGVIVSDEAFDEGFEPSLSNFTRQESYPEGPNRWKQIYLEMVSGAEIGGDYLDKIENPKARLQSKLALTTKVNTEKYSNAGNCTPSAAERAEEPYTVTEYPLETSVGFNLSTPFQERVKPIQVDSAVSLEQMQRIGQVRGAELMGRAKGSEFQLPLTDDILLETDPLPTWRFILPTGEEHIVQVNGLQFSHDPDRAICSGMGLRLLTIPAPTIANPTPPAVPPYPALDIPDPIPGANGATAPPIYSIPLPPTVSRPLAIGGGGGINFDYTFTISVPAVVVTMGSGGGCEFTDVPTYTQLSTGTLTIGAGGGVLTTIPSIPLSFLAERGSGSGVAFADRSIQSATDLLIGMGGAVLLVPTETHLIGAGGGVVFTEQPPADILLAAAGSGILFVEQAIEVSIVGGGSGVTFDPVTVVVVVAGAGGTTIFS